MARRNVDTAGLPKEACMNCTKERSEGSDITALHSALELLLSDCPGAVSGIVQN